MYKIVWRRRVWRNINRQWIYGLSVYRTVQDAQIQVALLRASSAIITTTRSLRPRKVDTKLTLNRQKERFLSCFVQLNMILFS